MTQPEAQTDLEKQITVFRTLMNEPCKKFWGSFLKKISKAHDKVPNMGHCAVELGDMLSQVILFTYYNMEEGTNKSQKQIQLAIARCVLEGFLNLCIAAGMNFNEMVQDWKERYTDKRIAEMRVSFSETYERMENP